MSCELKLIAKCIDLAKIKKFLSQEDVLNKEEPSSSDVKQDWLRTSKVAVSPSGDVMVVARKNQMIVLTQKWDANEESDVKMKYSVTWKGCPCQQSSEEITSVICLPLITQGQSQHGGSDWTCIAVGFSSGYIRFYTETGNFLTSELLHNEPVSQVKCLTYSMSRSKISTVPDVVEQVIIVYKTVICSIPGFSLFQTLRACRNQLARLRANSSSTTLSTISLDYKKYGFSDCDCVTDACFVGQTTSNTFDHLVTASLCGGFDSYYRPSPPQSNLIIATGRNPCIGYHYTIEGGGGPILTDVAKAVANKLKSTVTSAIPDWFGLGSKKSQSETKQKEQMLEPAEQLGCRFGLCDLWRHGDNVVLSPDKRLSAVTDSLGRVLLVDNKTGVSVRMWKGYRDAQCGFLEVTEDLHKSRHRKSRHETSPTQQARRVLFLVIYAPKKGLVEVYVTQHGPRIASFQTSKNGSLLYTPHGLVGLSSAPSKGGNNSQLPVVFVDDDGIKEIVVPFHLALSDVNSKKARDLHLLKKLKSFLREEEYDDEKLKEVVEKCCLELQTDEVRLQLIELLSNNKNITSTVFQQALNVFIDYYTAKDPETIDQLGQNIVMLSEQLMKLLTFYDCTRELNNIPPNYNTVVSQQNMNVEEYSDKLLMNEKDIELFVDFVNLIHDLESKMIKKKDAKVMFEDVRSSDLVQYLFCFDLDKLLTVGEGKVSLKCNLNKEQLRCVGEVMFQGVLYSDDNVQLWKTNAELNNISPVCLINCLLHYWLFKKQATNLFNEMLTLIDILKVVCSIEDYNTIIEDYNTPSTWWTTIRSILENSKYSLQALVASVGCRAVTIYVEQQHELEKVNGKEKKVEKAESDNNNPGDGGTSTSSRHDWENVSQDTCQWDMLIPQLEDVTLLNTVLNMKFADTYNATHNQLLCLPHEHEAQSLNSLLCRGRGSVSELVAKWLTQFGIDPRILIDKTDVEFEVVENGVRKDRRSRLGAKDGLALVVDDAVEAKPEDEFSLVVTEHIQLLKKRYPYSLSSSVLLSNLCWEYLIHWFKNVEQVQVLESAIKCMQVIPSYHVRHGITHLAWSTYIKHHFELVSKLINKVGKVPKEKLCKQECNMSNLQITELLRNTTDVLNLLLETNLSNTLAMSYDFNTYEGLLWFNDKCNNCPSLVNLSLSQSVVNDDLVMLHLQLSLVMYMISALNVRLHRPVSTLFDNVSQCEFFSDLTSYPQLPTHHVDNKLKSCRLQFLYKTISKSVETIQLIEDIIPQQQQGGADYLAGTKLDTSVCNKWIRLVHELATMWSLTLDDLRRHHACELYSTGYDRLAEEVISTVSERAMLASQLLVVCGQRLIVLIHNSTDLGERLSNLTPALSAWLDRLSIETLKNHSSTLSDLTVVLSQILQWLPETHPDLQLAILMADAIQGLEN